MARDDSIHNPLGACRMDARASRWYRGAPRRESRRGASRYHGTALSPVILISMTPLMWLAAPWWFTAGLLFGVAMAACVAWVITSARTKDDDDACRDRHKRTRIEERCRAIMDRAMAVRDKQLRKQREVLSSVLNSVPHAVYWKDRDSIYLGCNALFARIVGLCDPHEVIGRTDSELPWPDGDGAAHHACDESVMVDGRPCVAVAEPRRTASGDVRAMMASRIPLRDADASIFGMLGLLIDDTERLHVEEALHESEAKLQTILSQIPAILWTTDAELRVTSMNGGALEQIGIDASVAAGKNISDLLHVEESEQGTKAQSHEGTAVESGPSHFASAAKAHRRAMMGDEVGFRLRRGRRELDVLVEPLLDGGGSVVGCIGLAVDITERRQARKHERDRRNLEEAVAAMEQVIGVIGHELRTPLSGLRAMAEYLLAEAGSAAPPSESAHTFLNAMHDEVVRLSQMVHNMLEAARISSGRAQWEWATVPLAAVCRETVALITAMIDQKRITVNAVVEPNDLTINGDRDAIHRLLLNLLSNAQRHTSDGTIELLVKRLPKDQAEAGEQWIEIIVRDTGRGIPRALTDRLGVPFALNSGVIGGNGEDPAAAVGSGLGISICNGIAAAHGGTLRIESEVGRGTTVTVRLRADLPRPSSSSGTAILHDASVVGSTLLHAV